VVRFAWADPTFHLAPLVLVAGLVAWFAEATSRTDSRPTRRQRWAFGGGALALFVAMSWPLADLATSTSLLGIVVQRQLLVLAAAPLLLLGTPPSVTARLTRPGPIDAVASRLARPVLAIATTTVLLGVTAMPFSVSAASSSIVVRTVILGVNLFAGIVLWLPVIERIPGMPHLRPMAKGGYLMAQSVAPTFLSFTWIFALHPLYHSLHGQRAALGISPLTDQQLSGYLAKLGTFGVLWTVAFVLFVRDSDDDHEGEQDLRWIDVERALERADRRERRSQTGRPPPP